MVTQVIKTIGTGGDYPDWVTAKAAMPVNLVTADQQWVLKFKKQKHVKMLIEGITTDATRNIVITTDTGASYVDDPSYATNPLRYDASKGAAIELTTAYDSALYCTVPYTKIEKLQFGSFNTSGSSIPSVNINNVTGCLIDRCIIMGYAADVADNLQFPLRLYGPSTIANSLVVQRGSAANLLIAALLYGAKAVNTGFVSSTIKLDSGVRCTGGSTMTNCYVMNATLPEEAAGATITKTKCYSDATATGYTTVPYSTVTFVSVATDGTHDYRLPTGSALIDQGSVATEGATSINGVTRSTYDIGPWEYGSGGGAVVVPPNLTTPTGTATGATTASGSVLTDKAGGLLYFKATTNATETAATVKTGGSVSVAATGAQNVLFTGLTAGTTYYAHYLQVITAGTEESTVANSGQFTTPAADAAAPTFAAGAAITTGTVTQTSIAFTGPAATDNVAVTGYESSKDGGTTWQDNGTGTAAVFNSLAAGTTYQIAWRAYDAAGNRSAVITKSIATSAAPVATTGSFKTRTLANNTATAWAAGTAVAWEWHQARIGTQGSITYGSGTLASDQTLTVSGVPLGAGFLLAAVQGASLAADRPYYQAGTAA